MTTILTYTRGINTIDLGEWGLHTEKVWHVNFDRTYIGHISYDKELKEHTCWPDNNSDYITGGLTLTECKENLERHIQSTNSLKPNTMNDFKVVNCGQRDVDNIKIEVYYTPTDEMVASGQYNIRTNWAHVTREEVYENMLGSDWEDEMQEAIEERTIEIG